MIKERALLATGKRGLAFLSTWKGKKAVVKVVNPKSKAINRLENEVSFLRILNRADIGPKLYHADKEKIVMELIEGERIEDFLKQATRKQALDVLRQVLLQCRKLDIMKIDKEEMNHPYKHIIVRKKVKERAREKEKGKRKAEKAEAVMIDFERCRKTQKPKNVTQFCQFVVGRRITPILEEKGIFIDSAEMRKMAAEYKKNSGNEFVRILECFRHRRRLSGKA